MTFTASNGGGTNVPLSDPLTFLEMLRKQIDSNLRHHDPEQCPMSKKDIFDLGQLQQEKYFEEEVHSYGISVKTMFHNSSSGVLYEQALMHEKDTYISDSGALCCSSGNKTGRSPADKRIVDEPQSTEDVWWGKVNIPINEKSYLINRERALDYINLQDRVFVVDAFAGWDKRHRVKVRVIATRAYHALFMENMLVRPTADEIIDFRPDFVIYNAGVFPANRYTPGVTSPTSVSMHFRRKEMCILGTQYAGEMKKGILTLMMYLMPKAGVLPLHASCNIGLKPGVTDRIRKKDGFSLDTKSVKTEDISDVTLFFGLSGTGKTTLSADPQRLLVGDDEHVWSADGVFNVEGGCYAKCKDLSAELEPEIFNAIRFGSVLENVVFDADTRAVDYSDVSITENTRCAYPLEFIPNAIIPAIVHRHPDNIILLTCDAFGVIPPVSMLTLEQVMYHFISGYTSKMAGTEHGILEPTATFSSCYGAPFLAMHPMVYAEMLAKKMKETGSRGWLINTGWIYGAYGSDEGKRIPLRYTRIMIDRIHDGTLATVEFEVMNVFGLKVPKAIDGVPAGILMPTRAWADSKQCLNEINKLGFSFIENFKNFHDRVNADLIDAGPHPLT